MAPGFAATAPGGFRQQPEHGGVLGTALGQFVEFPVGRVGVALQERLAQQLAGRWVAWHQAQLTPGTLDGLVDAPAFQRHLDGAGGQQGGIRVGPCQAVERIQCRAGLAGPGVDQRLQIALGVRRRLVLAHHRHRLAGRTLVDRQQCPGTDELVLQFIRCRARHPGLVDPGLGVADA